MNINTNRLSNVERLFCGAISKKLEKHSQEYFVLAVLRFLFEDKYETTICSDRPDLQGVEIGIEVTLEYSQANGHGF